jgi:dihydrolipoamide dehydrogenase
MEKKSFDLAIIGSGPGGYVAAIKGAQLGLKVALIEKCHVGGTCLNVGCIPTKSLLAHAETLVKIKESKKFNIHVENISFDYAEMVATKNRVVCDLRKSLEQLILSNQVTIFRGEAKFISPKELKILGQDNLILNAQKIIIATGSDSVEIPAFPFDCHRIHSSTSILCMSHLPASLIIIGGGYIGCEFASLFSDLGVKITIIEALPVLLATQEPLIANELTKIFKKRGIDIRTNSKVDHIEKRESDLTVCLANGDRIEGEIALICVGRKPHTESLDLQNAGLATNDRKALVVNDKMETSVAGIYAIGDVTGKWMLAHVASHQGLIAAANAAGQSMHMDYHAVPAVVFTNPQIATVGLTLEQAKKESPSAASFIYPFQALGKAQATLDTTGFVQIISDTKTGQIFGAHMIGHEASSLIGEMAVAIQNELTLSSIIETIHAHPTLTELWMEAALIANQTPLHFPPKKKP